MCTRQLICVPVTSSSISSIWGSISEINSKFIISFSFLVLFLGNQSELKYIYIKENLFHSAEFPPLHLVLQLHESGPSFFPFVGQFPTYQLQGTPLYPNWLVEFVITKGVEKLVSLWIKLLSGAHFWLLRRLSGCRGGLDDQNGWWVIVFAQELFLVKS